MSPETTHDVAGTVTVQVCPPPPEAVTRYVDGGPPVLGATTVTVAEAGPATAVGVPGVPGAEICVDDEDGEAIDVPPTFVAVAANV